MSEMYGAVWVPDWSLAAAISSALIDPDENAAICDQSVRVVSPRARRAGVKPGDTKRHALYLSPEIKIIAHNLERDERMFMSVVEAVNNHVAAPIIIRPGLIVFRAEPPVRLVGSYGALADVLVEAVAECGEECLVGFGGGYVAAILAARLGVCVSERDTLSFLSGQPLWDALHAAPEGNIRKEWEECIALCNSLGITTMGELHRLPLRDVASRFGRAGSALWDIAAGRDYFFQGSHSVSEVVTARRHVDGIGTSDQATFLAKELADELAGKLGERGQVTSALTVVARFSDGSEKQRTWSVDGASQARDFTDRVRWQIAGWLTHGETVGELVFLELNATDLLGAGQRQVPLIGQKNRLPEQAQRAVLKVQSLIGDDGALAVSWVGSRVPTQAVHYENWSLSVKQAKNDGPWVGQLPQPWPATVFPDPIVVDIQCRCSHRFYVTADNQGACTKCADAAPGRLLLPRPMTERLSPSHAHAICMLGSSQDVHDFAGPWCIAGRWWDKGYRRAYMQLTVAGGPPLLVYRQKAEWFLEGVYN